MTQDLLQKIEAVAEAALRRIGAPDIQKKVHLAVMFARSQPAVEIDLDGAKVSAVAVDIATVFTPDGDYHLSVDSHGQIVEVESIQALSILVVEKDVILCKSTYDVLPGSGYEDEKYINCEYRTTDVDMLTENYIC